MTLVLDLTDAQQEKLEPLLTPKRRPDGRGRLGPDARTVLNGILWVLRTGAPWHDLPDRRIKPATVAFSSSSAMARSLASCIAWNS